MRLVLVLLVNAHLLLRGVAVPHGHEMEAEIPGHANRAHVHLLGLGHHHGHELTHHDETSDPRAKSPPVHESAPDHDHDAVYLDDGLILATAGPAVPRHTAADWLRMPAGSEPIPAPVIGAAPRRVRPPGDGVPAVHGLLPHVLRV